MAEAFETWATAEIARLRGEADHLQRTLARYLLSQSDHGSVAPARSDKPAQSPALIEEQPSLSSFQEKPAETAVAQKRYGNVGKHAPLLDAIQAAGSNGLTSNEIYVLAEQKGLGTNRNALRSFLWNQKQSGRLVSLTAGRYAFAQRAEAADQAHTAPSAASSSTPNHAYAARGGGT